MKKTQLKTINIDLPGWMVKQIDKEAARLGTNRKSVINFLLAQSLTDKRPKEIPSQEAGYRRAVEKSFAREWNSEDDDEGFGKL